MIVFSKRISWSLKAINNRSILYACSTVTIKQNDGLIIFNAIYFVMTEMNRFCFRFKTTKKKTKNETVVNERWQFLLFDDRQQSLTIVNNDPSFSTVIDDPSLTINDNLFRTKYIFWPENLRSENIYVFSLSKNNI